jgi:hypothetical protein
MSKMNSTHSIAAEEHRTLVVREGGADVLPLWFCLFDGDDFDGDDSRRMPGETGSF